MRCHAYVTSEQGRDAGQTITLISPHMVSASVSPAVGFPQKQLLHERPDSEQDNVRWPSVQWVYRQPSRSLLHPRRRLFYPLSSFSLLVFVPSRTISKGDNRQDQTASVLPTPQSSSILCRQRIHALPRTLAHAKLTVSRTLLRAGMHSGISIRVHPLMIRRFRCIISYFWFPLLVSYLRSQTECVQKYHLMRTSLISREYRTLNQLQLFWTRPCWRQTEYGIY